MVLSRGWTLFRVFLDWVRVEPVLLWPRVTICECFCKRVRFFASQESVDLINIYNSFPLLSFYSALTSQHVVIRRRGLGVKVSPEAVFSLLFSAAGPSLYSELYLLVYSNMLFKNINIPFLPFWTMCVLEYFKINLLDRERLSISDSLLYKEGLFRIIVYTYIFYKRSKSNLFL